MADSFAVTSVSEWLRLSEVPLPEIGDQATQGLVLDVQKVGFLSAPLGDCRALGIQVSSSPEGRCILPTVVVRGEHGDDLRRLPLELAAWAYDCVALARSGMKPFPSKIEFGVLRGKPFAEIL